MTTPNVYTRLLIGALAALLALTPVWPSPPVDAQSMTKYVWEKAFVIPNASPSAAEQDVRDALQAALQQAIDFCCTGRPTPRYLGPFYVAQGYIAEDFYWLDPGETVLVLSEALDFATPAQRSEIIRYLKYVMQTATYNPLTYSIRTGVTHSILDRNNFRSYYPPLPSELARGYLNKDWGPRPQDLYAAWAFGYYVSRYETTTPTAWDILKGQKASLDALFNTIPGTPRTYWQVMGAIGYARIARKAGWAYSAAQTRAVNGLAAGVNYVQFYRNMATDEFCQGNQGPNASVYAWDYCGFTAVNPVDLYGAPRFSHSNYAGQELQNKPSMFAIEIGRFLKENAQTMTVEHVNRYLNSSGSPTYGYAYFPFWWENRGQKPWAVRDENTGLDGNGENAIMHPSFAWQMFMLKAHVEGAGLSSARADEMKKYLDAPWAIGDLFYLQKLVTVLRMYSTVQWMEAEIGSPFMTAIPGGADQNQTVTFTTTLFGSGQTQYFTDTLPVQLNFVSAATTCPLPQPSPGGTVTYSGTPSLGLVCTITIQTTVNTNQRMAVVNSATVTVAGAPMTLSATVVLNPLRGFLPVIRR